MKKQQTFEEYLEEKADGCFEGVKDQWENHRDTWFSNLDVQDVIDYGQIWGEKQFINGQIAGLDKAKEILKT